MRIGIMLRALDEKFGVGVYTSNITDSLLKIDRQNEYILFYRHKQQMGNFSAYPNVEERYVPAPNKLFWDQLAIPIAAKRERIDVLFHPKFTIPLLARCKTVMVIHGASWFVHPELYKDKLDLTYIKAVMPLYCRKANAIIANSNLTKSDFVKILHVPPEKIKTIYFGINPIFKQIEDQQWLKTVQEKYNLPSHFLLTVGRYDPRKNFSTVLNAYRQCRKTSDLKLVAVGKDSWKYMDNLDVKDLSIEEDVIFTGYVEQEYLPAFYNLAQAFIFPSVYEEFGIPILEAMACGCPIVASNTGALPEIAGEAAFTANPFDASRMAVGINRILNDIDFRNQLINNGFEQTRKYDWNKTALETLNVLNQTGMGQPLRIHCSQGEIEGNEHRPPSR